jgi:DNA-binding transcriptional LysR family regulator
VRLLRRTTRTLALTDAGEAFLRHARIVLDAVGQAEASVRRADDVVRGDLRVSVPPTMSEGFFAMISEFAGRYPDVRLHVFSSAAAVDLRRDGWDVALRASVDIEPGLVARTLARSSIVGVASPSYLATSGVPRRRKDLARHRCLMTYGRDGLPQARWPSRKGSFRVEGSFFSNDLSLVTDAARRGLGIAMLPLVFAQPLLDSSELVRVLPGVLEVDTVVAAVYPERELVPPPVRAFVDALVAWAPTELGRLGGGTRRRP